MVHEALLEKKQVKGEEMNKPDRILISFCIPTYNRAELVKRCVKSILEIDSREIEVVVVDNASPDSTEETLKSIDDARISYYKNQTNLGAVMNIVQTIRRARGEWVFLMSDEDAIVRNSVEEIIADLSTGDLSDFAVMMGNVRNYDGTYYYRFENARYSKGDEAVCHVGFSHHYMSGLMISKRHIVAEQLEACSPSDGMYPHVNLLTRAVVKGGAITMDKDMCTVDCYEGRISYVEKPNGQFYFHPNNRFEQFRVFTKIANTSIENPDLRVGMMERLFFQYLEMSTFSWEYVIKTESIRKHFGVDEKTEFDFWTEAKRFSSRAMEYYEEIISDPDIRKRLEDSISKKMLRFRLRRMLVRAPIPEPVKKIVRPAYQKMTRLRAN